MLIPFWSECKDAIAMMGDVFPTVDEDLLKAFAEGPCQQTTMLFEHAAIGTDLDGGFGSEQTPTGLDTIADLQKIADVLRGRGYTDADVDAVFNGNWRRLLRAQLPIS